jgi:cohesin domain-containing protein
MKRIFGFLLAMGLAWTVVANVHAQDAETIWIAANTTAYEAGETVIVTVNARAATPIQGFTFQIRYDPACLKPVNAASPIPSMNGLLLPQTPGLVDASFASTTPQIVDGVLAEVQFLSLASCQTNLVLESAALAIRNQSGFAEPLSGIGAGEKSLALDIGPGTGVAQSTPPLVGTPLPLGTKGATQPNLIIWAVITLLVLIVLGGVMFWLLKLSNRGPAR